MSHDDIFKLIFILVIIRVDAFKIFVQRFINIYNMFPPYTGLPHTDSHLNDDTEIKPVNPIDGLETRSQSSLSEDLPVDASNTPTPPTVRNPGLNIPDAGTLSSLGGT